MKKNSQDGLIRSVSMPVGPGSLEVGTEGDLSNLVGRARKALLTPAAGKPAIDKKLAMDIPVKAVRSDIKVTSRYNDHSPFLGGARLVRPASGPYQCSSGFDIAGNGMTGLLTVGHCGWPGAAFRTGNQSQAIGTAGWENVAHDLMTINTSAANNIYDGSADPSGAGVGEFTKNVVGWDYTFPNERICQSGSTSGAICGIVNRNDFQLDYCSQVTNECYNDLVVADAGGGIVNRQGDSGGPVFTLAGDGQVNAKGIVHGGANRVGSTSPEAYQVLIYQDFATAWRDFGVGPKSLPTVKNVYSGRCLVDADWPVNQNGDKAKLWDCAAGSLVEQWTRNGRGQGEFTLAFNNRCLDADLNTIGSNGTKVQLWDCNNSPRQHWLWAGDASIINAHSGRCLDAALDTIGGNGTRIQLWDCNGGRQQKWYR